MYLLLWLKGHVLWQKGRCKEADVMPIVGHCYFTAPAGALLLLLLPAHVHWAGLWLSAYPQVGQ
jgi:hypothetical protein